jgi:sRNA-binding regulator protein Hfq
MKKLPKGRTLAEFLPLQPGETALLQACAEGELAKFADKRPTEHTAANAVRASFIRFLALGGDDEAPIHEHGVQLAGAWIEGVLDLEGTITLSGLLLAKSHFESVPVFRDAQITGPLNLSGSLVSGVKADRLQCKGTVFLKNGFTATGEVRLLGALIDGNLECNGAKLGEKKGDALSVDHSVIKGSVFLSDGFTATGEVRLLGVQIGGNLECNGAKLDGKDGDALSADHSVIKGDVFLSDGFIATGSVRLLGAQIDGNLECNGAKLDGKEGNALSVERSTIKGSVFLSDGFTATGQVRLLGTQIDGNLVCNGANMDGKNGDALSADRFVIKGSVFLSIGFTATGTIRLPGAKIDGNLECIGAKLDGKDGHTLSADNAVIKGNVFLSDGFTANGTVRLLGTQIDGILECRGAKLDGKKGAALAADRSVIKGSVFLSKGFTATGEVRLLGAQINGNLECKGTKLDGKKGAALAADRSVIKGSVFLSEGFTATGEVRLLGAQIGGNLACNGAKFDNKKGYALSADGMTVRGSFLFCDLAAPVHRINLSSVKVGQLIDDAASWGQELVLDGFVYEHLAGGASTNELARLAWLDKQNPEHIGAQDFRPHPWKQLQKVLRTMGHTEDARQVAIAFEDRLRAANLIGQAPTNWPAWKRTGYSRVAKGMHVVFKALIGYGYRPLRLGAWMLAVWLLCAFVFWSAALQGVMAPSNPLVFQNMPHYQSCSANWYLCGALPEEYTGFSPLAYSLDVLLPLVNLQQEQDWAPLIPTPKGTWYQELLGNWSFKHLVRLVLWFEILFGWVASLLLVAVVSGLTKRSEE